MRSPIMSDSRLHDGSPHDALTQKPFDPWARSAWVEQWVFAVVTCENTQAHKTSCHSTTFCMSDSGCSILVGKRGDGGMCEEALRLPTCGRMRGNMTLQKPLDPWARSAWLEQCV